MNYPSSLFPLSFIAIPGLGTQVTKRCVDFPPPSNASKHEKWKLLEDFYFSCSFVGHARQYPQTKEKIIPGEPGLVQPKMLLLPLNMTPGTQFYWIFIANLPNSVRKEGKELPFPCEFCYLHSQVNSVLYVRCSPLRSPPHNVLSSTQRIPKCASRIIQPQPLSRRVK